MGKLTMYLILMSGLTLLFYFTGLLEDTASSTLFNLLFNVQGISTNALVLSVLSITVLVGAATTLSTFFVVIDYRTILRAGFVTFMLSLFWDFLAVTAKIMSINVVFGVLFLAPLALVYILTVYEFFEQMET